MPETADDLQPVFVDRQVFAALQDNAIPLVDDANSVLRRLLGLNSSEVSPEPDSAAGRRTSPNSSSATSRRAKPPRPKSSPPKKPRAPRGSLLPEVEYEGPLLEALQELGGAGPSAEIIELLEKKLNGKLMPLDRETITSGDIRWRNRVQFVRLSLVKKGLMEKDSPRGTWAITEAGLEHIGGGS